MTSDKKLQTGRAAYTYNDKTCHCIATHIKYHHPLLEIISKLWLKLRECL